MASLEDEEERARLKSVQEKEMALARLKAIMDKETRAREQEIKALEMQMLERARVEKERIAKRNTSAMKVQSLARGYLGRQRVKAIQDSIEKERDARAKATEATLAAAEAKVAEAMPTTVKKPPLKASGSNTGMKMRRLRIPTVLALPGFVSAYAYQAAMASMMLGSAMCFRNPMMQQFANPMLQQQQQYTNAMVAANAGAVAPPQAGTEDASAPPDPWEKFFDQYTGGPCYCNNITGEKCWA